MDYCFDTSHLSPVFSNKAIPTPYYLDNEHHTDMFGTYCLSNELISFHRNSSFPEIYKQPAWENNLTAKNYTYQQYLSKKKVLVDTAEVPLKQSNAFHEETIRVANYGILNFILLIIIVNVLLIAWVKFNFYKYLRQISIALFNYNESTNLFRDHNALIERVYLVLNLVFIFTGGLLIFQIIKFNLPPGFNPSFYLLYLYSCLIVLSLFIAKVIILKSSGFILDQVRTFSEYQHSIFMYYKAMGITLLPLTAILSFIRPEYFSIVLFVSVGAVFILYFISIIRGTKIMIQKGVLLLYWILYLCTIEFLPLLLLYKFVRDQYMNL